MGVKLAQAGCDVSAVARGATLAALRQHGLRLEEGGSMHAVTLRASESPANLGPQDLVVVAVKAPAMTAVAAQIAPLLNADTLVLTAMNGVPWWFCEGLDGEYAGKRPKTIDADGSIAAAIPAAWVVGCVVYASSRLNAPGYVKHHQGSRLILGDATGKSGERVKSLCATLADAGLDASMSDRVQCDVWYKLWGNMTMNLVSAITGATTDRILGDDPVRGFVTNVMIEAKEIGVRFGVAIDQEPADRHATTLKLCAMKTSMLQDIEGRRTVELDALVGAVKELGKITGVSTPFTNALLGLARLQARTVRLYPEP
ncbi:2-dehydropantoate 2-reductase [Paraburkholderia sediminicola]|uniref:2-dehydropantoate 2-reductase n=1 Tax=Paraburkholderia sediminicola TaxID=458836 RepID=UPI0038BCA6CE